MAIGWQYVEGTAKKSDVLEGETFSSENAGTGATGTIPDNGSGNIDGPNDTMSGAGYYSSISNSITDRGVLDINGPNDSGNAGYYDRIDNNIEDRGSIGNLNPGEYGGSGYYSGGSVNNVSINLTEFDFDSEEGISYEFDKQSASTKSFSFSSGSGIIFMVCSGQMYDTRGSVNFLNINFNNVSPTQITSFNTYGIEDTNNTEGGMAVFSINSYDSFTIDMDFDDNGADIGSYGWKVVAIEISKN